MISKKLIKQIEQKCCLSFSGIYPKNFDFQQMAKDFIDERRAYEELKRLSLSLSMDLKSKKILEIGSGYGMFVAVAQKKFDMDSYGVEPSEQFIGTYSTSLLVLNEMGIYKSAIKMGFGEDIPYENGFFDIVYSSNVMEHVKDPAKVFLESVRVVKSGGYIVANIPNYGSWWEGHYGIFMLPYSPAWLLKLIVKMLGRDPSFVDTLQLVTFNKLQKWLSPCMESIDILDWGQNLWIERMKTLSFSEWAELGKLKRVLKFMHSCRLIKLGIYLGKLFHWETPFYLVIRKK